MPHYAGIGSRSTPQDVLDLMTQIAERLNRDHFILRSGGAKGADTAFEMGADVCEIFLARDATAESMAIAAQVHPAWERCNDYARKLHGRNAFQVLGRNLDSKVSFVICWTPGAAAVGGTATAIRIAERHGIPVFNLADPATRNRLEAYVAS